MSSLRGLSNSDLLDSTFRLASEERRITLAVIEHFWEIERRKAYSDLGFASLKAYAIGHLRYSEGSASRRIAAMWALRDCPELSSRIENGEVSVTVAARIQTTILRDEHITEVKWSEAEKKEAYREMGSLSVNALERRLVEISPFAAVREKVRLVTPELCEVTLHLTPEDVAQLEVLRGAYAHGMKNPGSNSEIVQKLIQMGMAELERTRNGPALRAKKGRAARKKQGSQENPKKTESSGSSPLAVKESESNSYAVEDSEAPPLAVKPDSVKPDGVKTASSPAVSAPDRRTVFKRANYRCQYLDKNGDRCKSRFFLQIEHRIPRALGGTNDLANLEVLCRNHNLIRGIERFGPEKMRRKSA